MVNIFSASWLRHIEIPQFLRFKNQIHTLYKLLVCHACPLMSEPSRAFPHFSLPQFLENATFFSLLSNISETFVPANTSYKNSANNQERTMQITTKPITNSKP